MSALRTRASAGAARGLTLLEIVVAAALGAVVVGLVGALLVASLGTWRRGRDLQEAQAYAAIVADAVARDVRNASQAPGVVLRPQLSAGDGEAVLAVAPVAGPDAHAGWVVYVYRQDRGEVVRQIVGADAQGRPVLRSARTVATGVVAFAVQPADGGVTVEVEVRRGRARGQVRTTVAPRNP
ncbi:MAG: hypothetical protein QN183_13470 [Armatimonadota bacterium]|nr:hypothetical protein [Armatimonadota bacterium]MDR7533560.1 hypothetical protein [Armatimonadota bacterium]MDR7537360.1 hypothetical protein [Armatimonadota bacterium]